MSVQSALRILLKKHKRVAITGGPRVGKSVLSDLVTDRKVISTDSYMDLEWSEVPHAIIRDLANESSYVIEGVMVPRALRKGLEIDVVIYMTVPKAPRTPRQVAMEKGVVKKVFDEWRITHPEVPVFIEGPKRGK